MIFIVLNTVFTNSARGMEAYRNHKLPSGIQCIKDRIYILLEMLDHTEIGDRQVIVNVLQQSK